MEKKIIVLIPILFLLLNCSTSENSKNIDETQIVGKGNYDTIFFANENIKTLVLEGAKTITNGIILETKGKGKSVWLDSLDYSIKLNGKFFLIASTPESKTLMLYFNGDSIIMEDVAINKPFIEDFKLNKSTVISIIDSSYNSGYLIKSVLFYQIDYNGILKNKKEYFPQKKDSEKQYDFTLMPEIVKDTLFIHKNKVVDYKYY